MILVVEESANDAELILSALERAWVSEPVMRVRTGNEALSYFRGEGKYGDRGAYPYPRLVLLDLGLPGVPGLEVLVWLRREPRFMMLPVVVLAGEAFRGEVDSAYRLGANSFVLKRGQTDDLARDVREVARYWLSVAALPESAKEGAGKEAR